MMGLRSAVTAGLLPPRLPMRLSVKMLAALPLALLLTGACALTPLASPAGAAPSVATAAPASAPSATGADTEQQAALLLREAAQKTQAIRSLYASFTQEKTLSILNMPLVSSGFMCLERPTPDGTTPQGAQHGAKERVLWVYEKPTPSGFAQEEGQAWLWTGEGATRRKAQGAESAALKTVTAQILAWVRIKPEELERMYRMERLNTEGTMNTTDAANIRDTTASAGAGPLLRLTLRASSAFFSRLEVTLAPTLDTVRQLRFVEKNGDSTVLRFTDTRVNAPLPPQCSSPQPLP